MLRNFTARYIKISSGYMGQILELPEVITEGKNIEECQAMLKDALIEMTLAHKQLGMELPNEKYLFEQISVDLENVC